MELQAIRLAASQGVISLPPPKDSELIEDKFVLKLCLKVLRLLSDFRESFARLEKPSTVGRLMLAAEAFQQTRGDNSVSIKDFFLSEISPDPTNLGLSRIANFIEATKEFADTSRYQAPNIATLTSIANHFWQDKIAWRQTLKYPNGLSYSSGCFYPPGEELHGQLKRWEDYCQNVRDLDPLVHSLLGSLYLTALAPLNTNNAAIGQLILQLALLRDSLNSPYPCIQLGAARRTKYKVEDFEEPKGLRIRHWGSFLIHHLTVLGTALTLTSELLQSIKMLKQQTEDHLDRLNLSNHKAFLETIFEYPACRTGEFSSITGTRRQVSSHILNDLCRAGILERQEIGRDKIFFHSRLLQLLEHPQYAFAPFSAEMTPFVGLWQKGVPGRAKKEPASVEPAAS